MRARTWATSTVIGMFALAGSGVVAYADPPDPTPTCELAPFDPTNPHAPLNTTPGCDTPLYTIGDVTEIWYQMEITMPYLNQVNTDTGVKGKKGKAPKAPKTPKAKSTGNVAPSDSGGTVTLIGPV